MNTEKHICKIQHNGKTIEIWLSDYQHGDQNMITVCVDNVMILNENIQAEF